MFTVTLVTLSACSAEDQITTAEDAVRCEVLLREASEEVEPGHYFATTRATVGEATDPEFAAARAEALDAACAILPEDRRRDCLHGHADFLTRLLESEQSPSGEYRVVLEVAPRAIESHAVATDVGEENACAAAIELACQQVTAGARCVDSGEYSIVETKAEITPDPSGHSTGTGVWDCTVPSCTIKGQCATSCVSWGWHCNWLSLTCGEGHDGTASVDYQTSPTACKRTQTANMCAVAQAACAGCVSGCGYNKTMAGWSYTSSSDKTGVVEERNGTAGRARDCDFAALWGCPCPGTFTGSCSSKTTCTFRPTES